MQESKGFTLIELLIAVAIVGILAAVAYPSYQQNLIRTHRTMATGCLLELAQFMERYYTTNMNYTGAALPNSTCRVELAARYGFNLVSDATTFTLTAAPRGAQVQDTQCGTLGLTHVGVRSETGSGTVADCW